jgi:hypothetical protein
MVTKACLIKTHAPITSISLTETPKSSLPNSQGNLARTAIGSAATIGPESKEGRQPMDCFGPGHGSGRTALTISRSQNHSMIGEHYTTEDVWMRVFTVVS